MKPFQLWAQRLPQLFVWPVCTYTQLRCKDYGDDDYNDDDCDDDCDDNGDDNDDDLLFAI